MDFPSNKRLKETKEKLEKVEGTLALKPNPTPLEKFRWNLCQKFIKFKRENNLSERELAELISTDEGKLSQILHHRMEEFSIDHLVTFCQMIDPNINIKVR